MKSIATILRLFVFGGVVFMAPAIDPALSGPTEVREIQKLLTDMGYAPGPVDGAWGGKTEAAARKFLDDKKRDAASVFGTGGRDDAALLAHINFVREAGRKAAEEARLRAAKGLALVIGNAAYKNVKALTNPAKDAALMTATLEAAGFLVTHLKDADQKTMKKEMRDFGRRLREHGKPGLFYYAGHAVQVGGANFLVPVGANIKDESEIEFEGVPMNAFLRTLERQTRSINMVVLDTYHRNPYGATFRSAERGFARADAPRGTYVAMAASPDRDGVAEGAEGKDYSPYSWALANAMLAPGLPIEEVFKRARSGLLTALPDAQPPYEVSSVTGDFVFLAADQSVDLAGVLDRAKSLGPFSLVGRPILFCDCSVASFTLNRKVYLTSDICTIVYWKKNGGALAFHDRASGLTFDRVGTWSNRSVREKDGTVFRYKEYLNANGKENSIQYKNQITIKGNKYGIRLNEYTIRVKPNNDCECSYKASSPVRNWKFHDVSCYLCKVYDEPIVSVVKKVWTKNNVFTRAFAASKRKPVGRRCPK